MYNSMCYIVNNRQKELNGRCITQCVTSSNAHIVIDCYHNFTAYWPYIILTCI